MKSESLKQILAFLTRILEKNDFNEDKQIIQYLFVGIYLFLMSAVFLSDSLYSLIIAK